ncbi:MAG: hypothetical protein ACRDF9_12070 [Candidatus Limnocylindria bacterium]
MVAPVDPEIDRRCAEATLGLLVAAVNDGDDARLSQLMGTSIWGSLSISGPTLWKPEEAVAALLELNRSGERWTLMRLDFNGRGWDGGVHFGLVVRRAGPDLPPPYVESTGKGVLDCPEGRLRILGIGSALAPRGTERPG